jgi:hypothetical protein
MVWFKRDTNTSFNRREESMLPFTRRLLSMVWLTRDTNTSFNRLSRVSQTIDHKRGVNGSMLSSRLLNDVLVSHVSQTIDYKRGVNGSMLHLTDARRACYHLLHVYSLWLDSHGTRTHHLTDARRAWYHLFHVYSLRLMCSCPVWVKPETANVE